MEMRSIVRAIIAGLVAIGLVILVIVLIVKSFSGGPTRPTGRVDVGNYADTSATVTLLIDDPTKIDQDHRQIKISVSNTQNEINIMQGYQGNVIDSRTYSNNSAAFGAFLQSLKLMNFSRGTINPKDYRGYCPTGDRYVFTFNDGNKDLFTYWSTSCGSVGTYGGNKIATLELIRAQIPVRDYDQLTSSISTGF